MSDSLELRPLEIAIIGGGPAGMKAAEAALAKSAKESYPINITLYEAKRSVGRKFLVAGKSGLNLTSNSTHSEFLSAYSSSDTNFPVQLWDRMLNEFSNSATREWAASLGIDTFVSAGKKVFPNPMKAAPLLRSWLKNLKESGLVIKVNHKLTDISYGEKVSLKFEDNEENYQYDKVIFALGGGSWKLTGSTGEWTSLFSSLGISFFPLSSANCGWEVPWKKEVLDTAEGLPLKNIVIHAGEQQVKGELVITKYGLEGAPIYKLGKYLRNNPILTIDLKPTFSIEQLVAKMESAKKNLVDEAVKRWKLSPAAAALISHYKDSAHLEVVELARLCKSLEIEFTGARPIDEAISTAGGVCWSELNEDLSLKQYPNIHIAGEMIDWEAPTGGFLLQACLATGYRAGNSLF